MKKSLTTLIFLPAILVLTGCGSNRPVQGFGEHSSSFSSLAGDNSDTTSTVGAKALCTSILGGGFQGSTQVFSMQGNLYRDSQQLRINIAPSTFTSSDSVLRFSSWNSGENQTTRVLFYLEDRASQIPISGIIDSISATDLTTFAAKNLGQTMTAAQTLGRINFVLLDTSSVNKTALRLSYFQSAALASEIDFLLPEFAADPNEFAQSHAADLVALHPNRALIGQNITDYITPIGQICF